MAGSVCTCACWPATTTTTALKPPSRRWLARSTTRPARTRASPRSPVHQRRYLIDLHVHTTASDGRLSPAEMVRAAAERGLSAVAITDHDVLWGLDEALAAAPAGLEVVPGIEMTCGWEGPRAVHVLGYFVEPSSAALQAAL